MDTQIRRTIIIWLVPLLVLSGCGGAATPTAPDTSGSGDTLTEVDATGVSGVIGITGSSTVFPLTAGIAEEFRQDGSTAKIDIKSTGTGGGFEVFCGGAEDIDIVNASRPVSEEEQAACTAQNRPVTAFQVGMDALAVVVNQDNDFIESLSLDQLAQIFSGEVTTWAELDPSYPSEQIALFSPGTDSGTFDIFVDEVFSGDDQPIQNAPDILLSENDYELAREMTDDPNAIGYFGYAYYQGNRNNLTAVAIGADSDSAVGPSEEAVQDGSYPFARPLFIYSSPTIMEEKPHVEAFISYYLQHVNEVIADVGYFPASTTALDEAQQALLEVTQ